MKYILHKKVTFRIGGRNISKVDRKEFIDKLRKFCSKTILIDLESSEEIYILNSTMKTVCSLGMGVDNNQIQKDFKGISYDSTAYRRIGSIRISPSGYPYLVGCVGGGSWGKEILVIVYYDGKKIRIYVPTCGNPWRLDTKEVLNEDLNENSSKGLGDKKYVIEDLIKTGQLPQGTSFDEPGIDVEFDLKSGIAEFYSRIMEV